MSTRLTALKRQLPLAARPNKGGHRDRALVLVSQAIAQVKAGIAFAAANDWGRQPSSNQPPTQLRNRGESVAERRDRRFDVGVAVGQGGEARLEGAGG
jgi:hypothetical protein